MRQVGAATDFGPARPGIADPPSRPKRSRETFLGFRFFLNRTTLRIEAPHRVMTTRFRSEVSRPGKIRFIFNEPCPPPNALPRRATNQ
jgi:hypothetical protein